MLIVEFTCPHDKNLNLLKTSEIISQKIKRIYGRLTYFFKRKHELAYNLGQKLLNFEATLISSIKEN